MSLAPVARPPCVGHCVEHLQAAAARHVPRWRCLAAGACRAPRLLRLAAVVPTKVCFVPARVTPTFLQGGEGAWREGRSGRGHTAIGSRACTHADFALLLSQGVCAGAPPRRAGLPRNRRRIWCSVPAPPALLRRHHARALRRGTPRQGPPCRAAPDGLLGGAAAAVGVCVAAPQVRLAVQHAVAATPARRC